jgi:catalase
MIWHFYLVDDDYGNRVGEGLGIKASDVAHLTPLPKQQLTEEDQQRLSNLGNNAPRKPSGDKITGSVHVKRLHEVPDAAGMGPSGNDAGGNGAGGNGAGAVPGDGTAAAADIRETAPSN